MNLIEKGEATLSRLLEKDASVTIVYRRGEEAVSLPATVGMTEFETDAQFGIESFISRDYIVDREQLVTSAGLIEPERGDRNLAETARSHVGMRRRLTGWRREMLRALGRNTLANSHEDC